MTSHNFESFASSLQSNVEQLSAVSGSYPALVDEIRDDVKSFLEAAKRKCDQGRVLSISVVGSVKSGKSTLLNALLFEGADILPHAATPMTATLTYIRHAEDCQAEISFFTQDEWSLFESKDKNYMAAYAQAKKRLEDAEREEQEAARLRRRHVHERHITDGMIDLEARRDLTDDLISAHELVKSARQSGLDIRQYLGTTQTLQAANPQELAGKLRDYVGADGTFTPLVCSTSIYLNDKRLKGYEIIDTPGTNDPIISRGEKTKRSLAKTDVVLAIGQASHFFDQGDWELLSNSLPRNGIKNFLLLASQYDLTVGEVSDSLDSGQDRLDLLCTCIGKVHQEIKDSFHQRVNELIRQRASSDSAEAEKLNRLKAIAPICVSAMAYNLSQHWGHLSPKKKEELDLINAMVPGFTFDQESLEQFSMIAEVRERLEDIKRDKARIIQEALKNLLAGSKGKFISLVQEMVSRIKQDIEILNNKDMKELEAGLKLQTQKLEHGRLTLENIFGDSIAGAQQNFSAILAELRHEKSRFTALNVQTESHTESYDVDVEVYRGGLGIMDAIFGPKHEIRTRSYTVTTRYAAVYDAVDQIEEFATLGQEKLEEGIRDALDVKTLQGKIYDGIMEMFENDADAVDWGLLKEQIKKAVRQITVPQADFGEKDYGTLITSTYSSSRVENADVDALKALQRKAVGDVLKDLEQSFKAKTAEITSSLTTTQNQFVNQLLADFQHDFDRLSAQLKNKQEAVAQLEKDRTVAEQVANALKTLSSQYASHE